MTSTYVSERVQAAQYAVRGLIPARAGEIREEMKAGKAFPFKSLIFSNIGNPQSLGQKPFTFHRQVMALVDCPTLLENPAIVKELPQDAVDRAREFLRAIDFKTGAYTDSQGYEVVRKDVAAFLDERDGLRGRADPRDIFLTDGASSGVKVILQAVVGGPHDGVMIPTPQYPLYSATITLLDGAAVPYPLDEENGWALRTEDLEKAYADAVARGVTPRVLVIINPGNPTGQVLSREVIENVIRFAHSKKIVLMADEVYMVNVWSNEKKFTSFRSALLSMAAPFSTETMLVSLHSTSKGVIGECGRRGGYFELLNIPDSLRAAAVKLCSINLCSNVNGQLMTSLMVRPPREGDASYALYRAEYDEIFQSLRRRAEHLVAELNKIPGFTCNAAEGAMYALPQIDLPVAFVAKCREAKIAPDTQYCLELLEATGIVTVPGSGFGQRDGTYHFRTTILPPEDQMAQMTVALREFHTSFLARFP